MKLACLLIISFSIWKLMDTISDEFVRHLHPLKGETVKRLNNLTSSEESMDFIREVYGFIGFQSVGNEKFRVHLNEESKGILNYHLEARASKKQWEGSIGKGEKVINGIPKEAVFNAFKIALDLLSSEIEDNSKKVAESSVDFLNFGAENEYLALKILVFGTWIGFELPVKSISLQEVDLLRAQVIDAQEEIETLKTMLASVPKQQVQFISVRANANAGNGGIISWPVLVHNSSADVFVLDGNNQTITVKEPGIYQIHVRIGIMNTANGNATHLNLNGSAIAQAFHSDTQSHQNTVQITEILVLGANDSLNVMSQTNSQNVITVKNCVFSVLKFAS